jgi:hypothetical protein
VQIAALRSGCGRRRPGKTRPQGPGPAAHRQSNIVTAEPMPGEETCAASSPPASNPGCWADRGEVFEKMKLAGEAGSLLKIEEEIKDAVAAAKKQWEESPKQEQLLLFPENAPRRDPARYDFSDLKQPRRSVNQSTAASLPTAYRLLPTDFWEQAEDRILDALKDYAEKAENGLAVRRRLFAEDTARGFAFIDLCRKRYDVVLMNPPFGEPAKLSKTLIEKSFPRTKNDVYAAFVERGLNLLQKGGMLGAITSRTGFFLSSFTKWREEILLKEARPTVFADLGYGVMDSAMVEAAAYCLEARL